MKIRKLALGVGLWSALAVMAACVVETGDETFDGENVGEATSALRNYGQSCNPFNNPCQPWLQCCGPFPHWEQYTCKCGPSCNTCTGGSCYQGVCNPGGSGCCPAGYKYCDGTPYGCIPSASTCTCIGK